MIITSVDGTALYSYADNFILKYRQILYAPTDKFMVIFYS